MNDLISRSALLDHLRAKGYGEGWLFDQIRAAPDVTPQVVANISGGVLQGASADYRVDLYTLDFEDVPSDDDDSVITVEGSEAYLGQCASHVDATFVNHVVTAPTRADEKEAVDA